MRPREARFVEKLALCERMGWTLDYIESLDVNIYYDSLAVLDALDKARNFKQRQASTGQVG